MSWRCASTSAQKLLRLAASKEFRCSISCSACMHTTHIRGCMRMAFNVDPMYKPASWSSVDELLCKPLPPTSHRAKATLLKPSARSQDNRTLEHTRLLLDMRLVGSKQAAQGSGVQVAQGIARRGRPLRSRLGHTHLLTRRQLPLRCELTINRPLQDNC